MSEFTEDELLAALEDADEREDSEEPEANNHNPRSVQDAHVAETVADRALRDRFCWAAGLNWMRFHRGRWTEATESTVAERVRRDLIDQHANEARKGAEADRLKALSALLSAPRIRAIVSLAKGILEVDPTLFDQHPDLLNVGNGVVELATGRLLDHDPALLLTKLTDVDYVPGATSRDWTAALQALPAPVAGWLQVRIGQAATGHPSPDDVMPVLQGGGSNGKTTITGTITRALGGHAVTVPERVLMANPSDHPTELMTLRGARLAVIEETPEARHLSVKRLKDTVGTPTMTARYVGRNNVTWSATHSLVLTTNYVPRVDETDHGTWRRLALVKFPYTFAAPGDEVTGENVRPGVSGLRERLRDGRNGEHEAVLAWIMAGARSWYDHDRVLPPPPDAVRSATAAWRSEADLICGYVSDRLRFDSDAHVITSDMYADFTTWMEARGHKRWADQTLTSRFSGHGIITDAKVVKKRTRSGPGLSRWGHSFDPPPAQYTAWFGVRFRKDDDLDPDEPQAVDLPKPEVVQGVQGHSAVPHEEHDIENSQPPLHSLHSNTSEPPVEPRRSYVESIHNRCSECGFDHDKQAPLADAWHAREGASK